jgi:hypothetical protein
METLELQRNFTDFLKETRIILKNNVLVFNQTELLLLLDDRGEKLRLASSRSDKNPNDNSLCFVLLSLNV